MGGPIGATGQLETPWVQALTACCGVEPINLFQQLPEYDNHDEFQESGLYLFPSALNAAVAGNLTEQLEPIFDDICNAEFRSKVANNKSFQAVSSKTTIPEKKTNFCIAAEAMFVLCSLHL